MGRPRKNISTEQVKTLAAINCSYAEIAAVVGCNESTLTRRFAQVIKEGRDQGKSSLKRMMWEACQKGNITMMIWLSKQMLGYTDKVEEKVTTEEKVVYKVNWADEGNSDPTQTPDPSAKTNLS